MLFPSMPSKDKDKKNYHILCCFAVYLFCSDIFGGSAFRGLRHRNDVFVLQILADIFHPLAQM